MLIKSIAILPWGQTRMKSVHFSFISDRIAQPQVYGAIVNQHYLRENHMREKKCIQLIKRHDIGLFFCFTFFAKQCAFAVSVECRNNFQVWPSL